MLAKREDMFVGQFPGCLVFADRTTHEHGDYKEIARVTSAGNVRYTNNPASLPQWARDAVEEQAEKKKREWKEYVEREIGYRPGYFYEKMLDDLPLDAFCDWILGKKTGLTAEECCRALLPVYERYC